MLNDTERHKIHLLSHLPRYGPNLWGSNPRGAGAIRGGSGLILAISTIFLALSSSQNIIGSLRMGPSTLILPSFGDHVITTTTSSGGFSFIFILFAITTPKTTFARFPVRVSYQVRTELFTFAFFIIEIRAVVRAIHLYKNR